MKMKKIFVGAVSLIVLILYSISCSDGKSYAELRKEEKDAVNAFFADKTVIKKLPTDSVLQGASGNTPAPYYQLDEDGEVYMQVVDTTEGYAMAKYKDEVYFRFERTDLKAWAAGENPISEGNFNDPLSPSYFSFGNFSSNSSLKWGTGLQLPLYFVKKGSVVNLVIKSKAGLTDEVSAVNPFLYKVRYN